MNYWQSWKYKNLTVLFFSIVVAIFLSRFEIFHTFLLTLGGLGYIGAFIAGILFVSVFTVATGAVILLVLSEELSPLTIGLVAGLGAVFGDYVIFRFVKDSLMKEIKPIYSSIGGNFLSRIFGTTLHTKYFSWLLPVIGAVIIASPLSDELGISLMGISKMKTYQFIFISFLLNAIGIFLVVSASLVIKP